MPLSDAEPSAKHVEVYEIAPLDDEDDDLEGEVSDFDDDAAAGQPQGGDQPQHDQGG